MSDIKDLKALEMILANKETIVYNPFIPLPKDALIDALQLIDKSIEATTSCPLTD